MSQAVIEKLQPSITELSTWIVRDGAATAQDLLSQYGLLATLLHTYSAELMLTLDEIPEAEIEQLAATINQSVIEVGRTLPDQLPPITEEEILQALWFVSNAERADESISFDEPTSLLNNE